MFKSVFCLKYTVSINYKNRIESSLKKKRRGENRTASPFPSGTEKDAQVVKMKSVKKMSEPKKTRMHLDAISKPSSCSKQRNGESSPLVENSNTVPKRKGKKASLTCQVVNSNSKQKESKEKILTDKFPKNFYQTNNSGNKENVMLSMEHLQAYTGSKKKTLGQQRSSQSRERNKTNIPCYGVSASKLKTFCVVGKPSRKLMFQENLSTGPEENVYDFEEDDTSSKRLCKRGKRKKQLDSSDEEYIPSKTRLVCKPKASDSSESIDISNYNIRCKRKNPNYNCKSKIENSPLAELLPKVCDEDTKESVSPDLFDRNLQFSSCNIALELSKTNDSKNTSFHDEKMYFKPLNEITSCRSLGKLHPSKMNYQFTSITSEHGEKTCCIKDSLSLTRTLTEDKIALICNVGDAPDGFKGFASSECIFTPHSKLCGCHHSLYGLKMLSTGGEETRQSKDLAVFQDKNGLKVTNAVVVENFNISNKISCSEGTDISYNICKGYVEHFSTSSEESVVVQSGVSSTKYFDVSHDDRKLHLKPVVALQRLVHPLSTRNNNCPTSGKRTRFKNSTVLDISNKENIPTSVLQSASKNRRQSRKLWRPTAYVSPKAYVKGNSSFEDTFDSPLRTVAESGVCSRVTWEDASSKCVLTRDSQFRDTRTSVCSQEELSSSTHSGFIMDSNRQSAGQRIDGILSLSSSHSKCADTSDRLSSPKKKDACVAVGSSDVNAVHTAISDQPVTCQEVKRVSAVHKSDSVSTMTMRVCNKGSNSHILHANFHSVSLSSDKDDSFVNKARPKIEIRASRGMTFQDSAITDQLTECNKDNYFGFDQEEPEEELLSPIKQATCAPLSHLSIATSSTPDHGTATAQQAVKPWRPVVGPVSGRSRKQVQSNLHSFLSKSAPQPKREETVTSSSLHHLASSARDITTSESMPVIFSVDDDLQLQYDCKQPPRRVYSHPKRTRKCKFDSLQEEQMKEDLGENISRMTVKKRSKKQDEKKQGEVIALQPITVCPQQPVPIGLSSRTLTTGEVSPPSFLFQSSLKIAGEPYPLVMPIRLGTSSTTGQRLPLLPACEDQQSAAGADQPRCRHHRRPSSSQQQPNQDLPCVKPTVGKPVPLSKTPVRRAFVTTPDFVLCWRLCAPLYTAAR
ncbi:hypothetical protein PR048_024144 [Dryococelus australis]|uniref:Uncharacterized protein n=1 Tax=Dryococelus australis TaxID=614101 RepID=A0ABQ9GW71_9NEOP|nr:hypothetical protein PR048_024144 [Dryococelus australis]